jgi:hypothetical protein
MHEHTLPGYRRPVLRDVDEHQERVVTVAHDLL